LIPGISAASAARSPSATAIMNAGFFVQRSLIPAPISLATTPRYRASQSLISSAVVEALEILIYHFQFYRSLSCSSN